ncbi:MAG: PKD domain-containing protein [Desulfobulbaceae bacterium]|nr:PKD domain-containing protein [Desulfobulbaceae bacterium]
MKKKMMKSLPMFLLLAMPGVAAAQLTYSFYEQSPHNGTSYMNSDNFSFSDCGNCHTADGVTGSWAFYTNRFLCTSCHVNESGPPYTLHAAPAMEVHSAAAIAGDAKGTLVRGCGSCHHGPTQNDWAHPPQIDHANPLLTPALAEGTYTTAGAWDPAEDTTTFSGVQMAVNDSHWSDPGTWNKKTGPGRGLMLEVIRDPNYRPRVWYGEIQAASANADGTLNIVIKGQLKNDVFEPFPPGILRVFYGQEVLSRIYTDTTAGPSSSWPSAVVRFLGRRDAANSDGLGAGGGDSTPDGICQVCHTTTSYWRADGSGTEHNSGLDCLGCHDHSNGFLPSCNSCHDYPPAIGTNDRHGRHTQLGYGCQVCHFETTPDGTAIGATHNNGTINVSPAPTFPGRPADGPQALSFTYTPAEGGGGCSANTCHAYWGYSNPAKWAQIVEMNVVPQLSALSSLDTDRVVTLDASRSSCFETVDGVPEERTCSYTWDFGGSGGSIGGNGQDVIIYRYDNAGSYTVELTMAEATSGKTATATVSATASLVETAAPAIDFTTSITGTAVTLHAAFPAGVQRVYIYWGDRLRSVYSRPATDVMSHTYAAGHRIYNIRVQTIDAAHKLVDYTFSQDGDLRVSLP